jgi:acetyl coenzyme A synthetase (ADP forming)-like protein
MVALSDGGVVRIRPITPADAPAHRAFFERLSPETVYFRFFSPKNKLSDRELEYFTSLDYVDRFAVVAVLDDEIIAVARYEKLSHPVDDGSGPVAEVAFVVDDDQQGRGLGTVLLEYLAAAARANGINRFVAQTLPNNSRMLEVFHHAGWQVTDRFDSGVIEIAFDIVPTAESIAIADERDRKAAARSVARLLEPTSVAVIGASRVPDSVGHAVFRNLLEGGFDGPVYPVNPSSPSVGGVAAYPTVADVPGPVDLAVIAVPAPVVPDVVRQCAAKGVAGLVILSAGFRETGAEGAELEREVLETCRMHGMRMIGPNCIGVANTVVGLNATFAPSAPMAGNVGFMSQSGGLGIALLEWTSRLGLGMSSFVSAGNKADVSGNDLIQYWEQDPSTDVILLYIESFGNPRKFGRIARRVSMNKPIVAVKGGRTSAGSRAASSHTAAAASSEVAVAALFRQAGVIRVDTLDELFSVAQVLATQPLPSGKRVAIVGNSGGPGILAADACTDAGLDVVVLSEATQHALRDLLGPKAAVANPVDLVAAAGAYEYEEALRMVLADERVDALLVIYTPPLVTTPDEIAEAVVRGVAGSPKPVVANFLGAGNVPRALKGEGEGIGAGVRVPTFASPEPAAIALGRVARYADWRRRDVGVLPEYDDVDKVAARALVDRVLAERPEGRWLHLDEGAELLTAYGIRIAPTRRAIDAEGAVAEAEALGFPVVLKAASGSLVHKTELGAVRVGLESPAEVREAFAQMSQRLGEQLGGVVVQPMVDRGVETIVGVVHDRSFGPLVMFGLGGVATELLADRAFRILPITDVDAAELVRSLKGSPLLTGYRGAEPSDLKALEELIMRLGALVQDVPEIAELDCNPVASTPHGAVALDVKVRLAPAPTAGLDSVRSLL